MALIVSSLEKSLRDLRAGRFVLVYDADGRVEETDMSVDSQFAGHDQI